MTSVREGIRCTDIRERPATDSSKRNLCPVGPFIGIAGGDGTHLERVERVLGHLNG